LRFFLKILVVLITAAAVFGYYFWDMRREGMKVSRKAIAWIAVLVVLGSVVGGFFIVGSPAHQRLVNFDERKVSDLQGIQSQIIYYWQQKAKLPATLADLKNDISGFQAPTDPQTNQAYEYTPKSNLSFELCANFNTTIVSSPRGAYPAFVPAPYPGDISSQNWTHGQGRTCFTRTIDPQFYKPVTPPVK
jgi:hypothetical protein